MSPANRVALFLVAAWSLSAQAEDWNASTEFTLNDPGGEWSYGYFRYASPGSSGGELPAFVPFNQMLASVDDSPRIGFWVHALDGGQARIARLGVEDRLVMVPGVTDSQELLTPVVRWTAPHDGSFEVPGHFSYLGSSLGIGPLFQAGLNIEGITVESFSLEAVGEVTAVRRVDDLSFGQHLDFFVTRGPHRVAMSVRISDVPEPDPWLLLAIGGGLS